MPDAVDAPSSLPAAEIVHRIPGRMRFRLPARRHDAAFFQRVENALSGVPGIRRVHANAGTASLLVEHNGIEAAVIAAARDLGLFSVRGPAGPASKLPAPLSADKVRAVGSSPLNVIALSLAGAGVLQLFRGQVVGSASENLWNAYGLYAVTRQAWPLAFLVPFGVLQIIRGEVLGSATSLFLYAYSARRMAQHRLTGGMA